MRIEMRSYQGDDDYWRVRPFLREAMLLNGRRESSWHVARWDYWRWHVFDNCHACDALNEVTFLWEAQDGAIAAVLNPEGRGEAHLQLNPRLRTRQLEEEMLVRAEDRLIRRRPDGSASLQVFADRNDSLRRDLLIERGYRLADRPEGAEFQRRRGLRAPVAAAAIPTGYTIRALGDEAELPARSWASWRAFHSAEPASAYDGWSWYRNIQRQPLYRRDLDIVAAPEALTATEFAPTGELASFCTAWYDDVTRTAYFEPVGTAPEHQRRGLGRAVIIEALRRLERMGCLQAFVGGYSLAANSLYASAGFTDFDTSEPWIREWPPARWARSHG